MVYKSPLSKSFYNLKKKCWLRGLRPRTSEVRPWASPKLTQRVHEYHSEKFLMAIFVFSTKNTMGKLREPIGKYEFYGFSGKSNIYVHYSLILQSKVAVDLGTRWHAIGFHTIKTRGQRIRLRIDRSLRLSRCSSSTTTKTAKKKFRRPSFPSKQSSSLSLQLRSTSLERRRRRRELRRVAERRRRRIESRRIVSCFASPTMT